ncbi:hypothetical protein [Crenobacter cavernae]|uniref:Uncharacterized protein n=1 Tax=Crenobacter cavernae TaxID=2290923 RepID=A0ABY0FJ19_9NEIS|nr:hypothetical protein [Crenobacter cavernae]RXZ45298.1 hypothetical protein EBB06_00275 [Crenobacter cavernae]
MKLLRLVLIFLLTLAIPAMGAPAVVMTMPSPCPMQHDMTMAMPADCCQMDADGSQAGPSVKAKSSSPCKPGQECKIGHAYSPAFASAGVRSVPATLAVVVHPDAVVLCRDPSGWWRPPRSL